MADFDVYLAGEEIDGIGMTYIYVSTYLGKVRMTREEAERLSGALAAAVRVDREGEDYEKELGNAG